MNNKGRKIAILLTAVGGILLVWLVKSLFLESYRIASGQMENTLLEGDRLWVNKCAYGIRLPQAWLALPFLHDAAVLHDHDAIRDLLRQSEIMCHEEHTAVLPRAALAQQCHDFLLCFDIQRRRRFIRNQNHWLICDGTTNRNTLLLSTR